MVEAEPSNREKSNAHHVTDPFRLFDTFDAAEVGVPCADLATPQPSTDVQFQPLREDIQGFYTIMPAGKYVPRDGHRRNSKKAHIILALQPLPSSHIASPTLSRTSPLRCWQQTSLEQRGANGASRNGRVRTAVQSSKLSLDCPGMPTHVVLSHRTQLWST